MKPADEKEILYQYDGAAGDSYNQIQSGGSIANIFTANGGAGCDEILKSVSLTLMNDSDVDYSIQIYKDLSDADDPTSGTPALSSPKKGRTTFQGVYNIPLDSDVRLKAGSRFSIVITLSHANNDPVKYDIDMTGYVGEWMMAVSAVLPNQSFEKDRKGASWDDLSSDKHDEPDGAECAARIKAITESTGEKSEEPADPDEPVDPSESDTAVKDGDVVTINGSTYVVTSAAKYTAALRKAKNVKSFKLPSTVNLADGKAYKVTQANSSSFTGSKIRQVTIGKNVRKLAKNAFKSSKSTKITLKTKLLKKSSVKGSLRKSKVKTVLVKVGSKKTNKKFVKTYRKIFTKKNAGRKVTVK